MEIHDADEIELKKNIHKKYLRTKYKEKNGHSRWERENSEEVVRNLHKRAAEKKIKFEKIREQKKIKEEEKIKQYFKPKVLDSCKSWERLKLTEDKVSKREKMKEIKRRQKVDEAVSNQEQRFINDNKNTVYVRMQDDLEYRKERDRKRKQLKKLKDLHYKEYLKLMHDECSDEEYGKS
jgi:trichohyalin